MVVDVARIACGAGRVTWRRLARWRRGVGRRRPGARVCATPARRLRATIRAAAWRTAPRGNRWSNAPLPRRAC